ncbi:MAG: DNRLRE domain-containing protein [Verrucomicrobiota bacterium]
MDTNLRQANPDLVDNLANGLSADWNDAGNTNMTQGLIRFDGIIGSGPNQIPPGARIHAALLELFSTGGDAMGDGGQFFALLQPWDASTTTWNSWDNGVQANGIEAALVPTAVVGNNSLNPDVQGTVNQIEVTSDVQAWVNGERGNYGWALLPWPNGSNAWISRTSEYFSFVDENNPNAEHPRLRVYYTAGAVGVPARLGALVASLSQVQVPFTGTAGFTYTVWRAPAVTGPWTSIGTAVVNDHGAANFNDSAPLSGGAFYRVSYP